MNYIAKLLILFSFFVSINYFSICQLSLQINVINAPFNVNTSEYPVLSAQIKAQYNGQPVELNKESINILESGSTFTAKAMDITPFVNGWQTVKWVPEMFSFDSFYVCRIYVLYENTLASQLGFGRLARVPYSIVTNQENLQIRDMFWEQVQPGNNIPVQIRFKGQINTSNPDGPYSMRLDSITTNTPYFSIKWVGSDSDFDRSPPPRDLRVGSSYWINVFFKPSEYKYYQDILTFHYEGGLKRFVPLYGNSFTVETQSLIQLLSPNGNEILSPCQDIDIKWKGHAPQYPTDVYYSENAGFTWNLIASVMDSVFSWKVPDTQSNSVLIKVKQNFNQSNSYQLSQDTRPVNAVGFNQFSTLLSSVNERGKILTYDLKSDPPNLLNTQFLGNSNETEEFNSFGLAYSPADSIYYVGHYRTDIPFNLQYDSIAVFDNTSTIPIRKIGVPDKIKVNKMIADLSNKYIAIIPVFGNQVFIYESKNFTLIKKLSFKSQVLDFTFNSGLNQAAALMLDGEIELINLVDYSIMKELKYNNFPNFVQIALSPNGKLLSIGSKTDNTGLKTNIYVVDIATERIVRVFTPSGGDPIGLFFNPSSSTLVVGSVSDMQIAFYDLTSSSTSGNLFGHFDKMLDIQLSPAGHSLASTSNSNDNLIYRTFVYPEEDLSDSYLSIHRPDLNLEQIVINPVYLGTKNTYPINSICNLSDVTAIFNYGDFNFNKHFSLYDNWIADTLFPSECFKFNVNFNPLDTGVIRDTLILRSCNSQYKIPFEAMSLPRNIAYLSNNYDFGDVCIGDTVVVDLPIIRNDDPVDLKVNFFQFESPYNKNFLINISKTDTTIPPGGVLYGKLRFIPDSLGNYEGVVTIYHSDQRQITAKFKVFGKGIGSYISLSHDKLLFIPEVLTRQFEIKNIGATDILFENIYVVPNNNFQVLTPTPFLLKPNELKIVSVSWNGVVQAATLVSDATPCLIQKYIPLDIYKGDAEIIIPRVETSSKNENLEIPIHVNIIQGEPYRGDRPFEATFEVNPKIFLPTSVQSNRGDAELISNISSSNKREFKVRVNGNFDESGLLATIKGVAGLSDTNYSDLIINESSLNFGTNVNVLVKNGGIFINDICNDRYIYNDLNQVEINGLSPNPANEYINLDFESTSVNDVRIELIDNLGSVLFSVNNFKTKIGTNRITFKINSLGIGNYKINIYSDVSVKSASFIIMR